MRTLQPLLCRLRQRGEAPTLGRAVALRISVALLQCQDPSRPLGVPERRGHQPEPPAKCRVVAAPVFHDLVEEVGVPPERLALRELALAAVGHLEPPELVLGVPEHADPSTRTLPSLTVPVDQER